VSLPPEIDHLYNLKKLFIRNNSIISLPAKLDDLVNLSVLDISNNPVHFHNDINQLSKLKTLDISNIPYDRFPQDLYDVQNNGTKIIGLKTKELYNVKLLLSQGKNMQLIKNNSGAIIKYSEALALDTNNAQALEGMASAYLDIGNYDSSAVACKMALTKNPNSDLLKEIQTTYSSALKRTNKYDEIISTYELKIKEFSSDASFCFALGKYYYDNAKYADAEKTFQRAIMINPNFANAHFYIAVTVLAQNREQAFLLASLRFLTIENSDRRAKTILPFIFTKMKMKTGVKSKTGSTHYYDSYIIRNEENEIVYKSENPTANLLGAMLADILTTDLTNDKSAKKDTLASQVLDQVFYKNKNNVEIFMVELEKLCNTKQEDKKKEDDFFWNYYQPYFSDLIKNGHLETFAYIINNMRREESYIKEWLQKNSNKIEKFNTWNKNYTWMK
jgi:tetratricopeptide (TPR) repeat protein